MICIINYYVNSIEISMSTKLVQRKSFCCCSIVGQQQQN